jgi:hypothetical protein
MTSVTRSASSQQFSEPAQIWHSLKSAIANSSGFNTWKGELPAGEVESAPLDHLVRRYLRETLATLAY